MLRIDPFHDEVFLKWFSQERHEYPKMTRCLLILNFVRRELIDMITANGRDGV